MDMIKLKRVYEPAAEDDGQRILVERLWPRGVSRERARVDLWLKEIAPSPELRKWYQHDVERWEEFRRRYEAELEANPGAVEKLRALLQAGPATLVYAARDEAHNSARVLKEWIETGEVK